jgi:uncharacterized protein (DUF362 family)
MTIQQGKILFSLMESWQKSVPILLEASALGRKAADHGMVLIKPNLVEVLEPPITTPVTLVETIVDYLLDYLPANNILIGEGCGSTSYDTFYTFDELGYSRLASEKNIRLLDLNTEKLVHKRNPAYQRWPEMFLPEILDRVFLISVPTLKAHSLAKVTLTMKNMMGCAPSSHYCGNGAWAKASFHTSIHEAIFDLNRYRSPDFTILDASIGMARAHLWGPQCNPPVGKVAVSFDPVAIDSYGASLLKKNWQDIGHIVMAHEVLGIADPLEVEEV